MRWVRRIGLGLLAALVLLVGGGAAWQAYSTHRDEQRFPMPGQRVDIGGRSLHLYCSGAGSPLVLLENGLGGNTVVWQPVQHEIARFTKVCSYDRAGMGFSDPSPKPTQSKFVAADLSALLDRAGIEGPMVLVGWSAGGVFARYFVHAHPRDVVGLVLVDSSHEQQGNRLPKPEGEADLEAQQNRMLDVCRGLAWTGLLRAMGVFEGFADAAHVESAMRERTIAMSNRSNYCSGIHHEGEGFPLDVKSVSPPSSLGALPLIVLTRGRPMKPGDLPFPISESYSQRVDTVWWQMQSELVQLSSHAKQIRLPDSGHMIPIERPDAVVAAVRELVTAQR